ncbi:ASCL4 protein, partial [Pardalotus punctatus]|nr:ASCL4 protein [Pardalotus punctatus]
NKGGDKPLKRIAFPGAVSLASVHLHPHGAPPEPFGVPFPLDPPFWDQTRGGRTAGIPYIPFPGYVGTCDYSLEPAFIRKRNERERQRVRCVNEGYTRLRAHLPGQGTDGRLSKVQTLRAAISYIKHLQALLAPGRAPAAWPEGLPAPAALRECGSDGESRASAASSPCGEGESRAS